MNLEILFNGVVTETMMQCPRCKKEAKRVWTSGIEDMDHPERAKCEQCWYDTDEEYRKTVKSNAERDRASAFCNAMIDSLKRDE